MDKDIELIKKLIELNHELRVIIDEVEFPALSDENLLLKLCYLGNFGKASKTHQSIIFLSQQLYGEDALVLARSLFEVIVNLKYITQRTDKQEERLERYMMYDFVQRQHMYETLRLSSKKLEKIAIERELEHQPYDISPKQITEKFEKFIKKYIDKKGNPPNTSTWSGLSIKKMAYSVGLKGTYDTAYELASKQVHSSSTAVNQFLTQDDQGKIVINNGPSKNFVDTALIAGFEHFCYLMNILNKEFQLNLDPKLENQVKKFESLMKEWY